MSAADARSGCSVLSSRSSLTSRDSARAGRAAARSAGKSEWGLLTFSDCGSAFSADAIVSDRAFRSIFMGISILMVGSEALPFSKTGGLADVLGALPMALGRLGHRVTLVTPKYRSTQGQGTTRTIRVPGIGGAIAETRVIEQRVAENVRAVLIDRPELYDRDSLYGTGGDYPDNPRRFAFLCAAALE